MFADDTQLFNKDERSVEKSFDILSKYEKASGSRINYNKTKAISIGTAKFIRNALHFNFKSTI
jgi:hypothetical protein